jgi:hypothetical protein
MSGYYDIVTRIYKELNNNPLVNQVTKGTLDVITNAKQNVYPLTHVMVNNATFETSVIRFNISIIAMDLVDYSKEETVNLYIGNNNEDDVLNTTLAILNRTYESMYRGAMDSDGYSLTGIATSEPFYDRFTDAVAGWTMTFDIEVYNDMTIC